MEKSEIEDLMKWSQAEIESSVAFYFMGTPKSHMLFDMGDPPKGDARHREKHIIYHVYGYLGRKPKELIHVLTNELKGAIERVDAPPLCIVWRRYPDLLDPDMGEDIYRFGMRFAVMDSNLDQVELSLPEVKDGAPYTHLEK